MPFLIGPPELDTRRERCRPVVAELSATARLFVPRCNLCGSDRTCILATHDRYGIPLRTALCTSCGLIYLMDRFTQDGYSNFYLDGAYRKLTSAFAGSVATIEDLQADQAAYARHLARFLDRRLPAQGGVRLLDIGGSSGEVARELAAQFGISGTVLDPSREEIEAARRQGLHGVVGSAETWETEERFDLVLLCRTVEHLYDLRATMAKIRRYLTPGGLLYCDFLDYLELCRITGAPQTVSKVDHCYWLTLPTAPAIFRAMGFEIVSFHIVPKPQFIGCLLRQCEPVAIEPMPWTAVEAIVRDLQQIVADWQRSAAAPAGLPARVRRKVSRIARTAVGH
jgi:SAM-dependent methyltransferase